MSESTTEEKVSRADKSASKARDAAVAAVRAAFKAYQRWQVAECIASDQVIDAGNVESFGDWINDELSK